MILLRHELGDVLREQRQAQGRTLREVSAAAGLPRLPQRGRARREGSLLRAARLDLRALDLPLSEVLGQVSERVADAEALTAPVSLPVAGTAMVSASAA